jgi:hypothetical protein
VHKFEVDRIQYHDAPDPVQEGEKPYEHEWTLNDIGDELENTATAVFNIGDNFNEVLQTLHQIQLDVRKAPSPVTMPPKDPYSAPTYNAPSNDDTKYEVLSDSGNSSEVPNRQSLGAISADIKGLKASVDVMMSKLDSITTQNTPSRDTDKLLNQLISRFENFVVSVITHFPITTLTESEEARSESPFAGTTNAWVLLNHRRTCSSCYSHNTGGRCIFAFKWRFAAQEIYIDRFDAPLVFLKV